MTKNLNVCAEFLVKNVNKHIRMEESSDKLKTADITLAFKKGGEHNKSNYRPVSALPILTKVYEKCLYKHIENYMENVLILDVVSERILIQQFFIAMIEKVKTEIDKVRHFSTLLTDYQKRLTAWLMM